MAKKQGAKLLGFAPCLKPYFKAVCYSDEDRSENIGRKHKSRQNALKARFLPWLHLFIINQPNEPIAPATIIIIHPNKQTFTAQN